MVADEPWGRTELSEEVVGMQGRAEFERIGHGSRGRDLAERSWQHLATQPPKMSAGADTRA